jgi:very-short-patch-repair endonuclease
VKATNLGPLFDMAGRQRGAFAATQADALGITGDVRKRLLARDVIRRSAAGLFVVAGAPLCWEQELWLAWLAAGPLAAIGGRAAAHAVDLPGHRRPAVEVLVPFGRNHRQPFGRIRETRWLPPDHIIHIDGLPPLTSVARTIFDLAGDPDRPRTFRVDQWRELHKQQIGRLISRSLRRNDFTMIAMMRMLAALGRRGRAGTTIVRELVHELGVDYVPTASDLEDLWLDMIRSEMIEEPERQVPISGPDGWLGTVDFAYLNRRVIWEVDGPDHDAPLQKRHDAERDAAMRAAGYDVHRAHWLCLINDPESVIKEVVDSIT